MSEGVRVYNIQLVIDSQLEHVRLLGSALRGIGQELTLPEEQLAQLELILVEAVNNVIEHAYEFKAGHSVRVRVECEPHHQIRLVVSDRGKSMPESAEGADHCHHQGFPDPDALPEGGWGLALIHALADSCCYVRDPSGNHLHVSKMLA